MTLRGYMNVITRTIFHLQVRIRSGTDDQAENRARLSWNRLSWNRLWVGTDLGNMCTQIR